MALDLSSLKKGVLSLEAAMRVAASEKAAAFTDEEKRVITAGVIQNFEFTYELCWKFMRRWLEANGDGAAVDGATRKEVFRIAAERQLITDPSLWFEYTKARNETAHTYDSGTAQEVYLKAAQFLPEAKKLLARLEAKND